VLNRVVAWLVVSLALVIREGRGNQRATQDALSQLPESRALDPLRGRHVMGGSPELIGESRSANGSSRPVFRAARESCR
jgi:hypothetical protein